MRDRFDIPATAPAKPKTFSARHRQFGLIAASTGKTKSFGGRSCHFFLWAQPVNGHTAEIYVFAEKMSRPLRDKCTLIPRRSRIKAPSRERTSQRSVGSSITAIHTAVSPEEKPSEKYSITRLSCQCCPHPVFGFFEGSLGKPSGQSLAACLFGDEAHLPASNYGRIPPFVILLFLYSASGLQSDRCACPIE